MRALEALARDGENADVTEQLSGWDQHRGAQRRAWPRLSYAERLRWLEQAKSFAGTALEAARRRRDSPPR